MNGPIFPLQPPPLTDSSININNTSQEFEIGDILGNPQIISRTGRSNLNSSEPVRSIGHHQHDENMDIEEELKDEEVKVSPKHTGTAYDYSVFFKKLIKSHNIHVDGGSQSSQSRKSAAKAVSMR
jgi:hypothetical protein